MSKTNHTKKIKWLRWSWLLALALTTSAVEAGSPDVQPEPSLGDAIRVSPDKLESGTATRPGATSSALAEPADGFAVDIQDRIAVLVLYHEVYLASEGYADRIAWTGDVNNCVAGDIAPVFREDTRRRINYFRAMAGLPADITFNPIKNAKAQAAALIYAANQVLTHNPIQDLPNGSCLSADGDEAGQHGNIALGTFGPGSVDAYIRDDGVNNAAVGHRRWLLYPPAVEMGSGSIPPGPYGSSANTIYVIGDFGPRPADPAWVSWPPPGYVPYALFSPRWSFSLPNANFSSATVTMSCDGDPVSLTQETVSTGYGDNSLVWKPSGLSATAPDPDRVYVVALDNVSVGGNPRSYNYTVIAMDPFNLGRTVTLDGPAQPYIGADNLYNFTPIPQTMDYELRSARADSTPWLEGAEVNPAPRISDGTTGGYSLYNTAVKRTGNRSFHLAFATFDDNDQTFDIDRVIIPSASSQLQFYSRFRFAGTTSRITAEISTDGGNLWTSLYERAGNGSTTSADWEPDWIATSVPLTDYAGQTVTVRFHFHYDPFTSVFLGTGDSLGVFIDDVTVTAAQELTDVTLSPVAGDATSVVFNPPVMGVYYLQMQPRLAGRWFGFGPALIVQANQAAPPAVHLSNITINDGMTVVIEFTVTNPSSASFHLYGAPALEGAFTEDTTAVLQTVVAGSQYRFTTTLGASARFFRVAMD
jgi:hypothetical protein